MKNLPFDKGTKRPLKVYILLGFALGRVFEEVRVLLLC